MVDDVILQFLSCTQVLVNEKTFKEAEKETYLGDYLNKYANPPDTMEDRRQKGEGIVSNITVMLEDVPLGKKRLEVGLMGSSIKNPAYWRHQLSRPMRIVRPIQI